jgi:hypothetical protein
MVARKQKKGIRKRAGQEPVPKNTPSMTYFLKIGPTN